MKRVLLFSLFAFALIALALVALPSTARALVLPNAGNRASEAAARQTDQLSNVIARADTLIATRLASLQRLLTRIQNDKKLTTADKASLTSDVQSAISGLTALKTKIDADTDLATARADAKSIITSYRVYAIFEPKIRLLVTINNLQTTSTNMAMLATKIQGLLDTLKSQGKDTTNAQTALTDVTTQLTAINTALSTDKTLVGNVSVSTTDPQSVFVQVRKDLAGVRADFAKIRADIAQIRSLLQINIPKGTVSTKPSPATESAK